MMEKIISVDGVEKEKWVTDKIVRGKSIHIQPKTHNQDLFLQSMRDNIIKIGRAHV